MFCTIVKDINTHLIWSSQNNVNDVRRYSWLSERWNYLNSRMRLVWKSHYSISWFPHSESSEEESACAREKQSNTKAEQSMHTESGEITHSRCFTNTRKSL